MPATGYRRRPYPFDVVLGSTGYMLARPKTGPLVGSSVQPFEGTDPPTYAYESVPPFLERPTPYDDLSLGFGLKRQHGLGDHRYAYALNVDCSVGGSWLKGPALGSITPATTDSTHGVARFFEMSLSGTLTLFAAVGRYILKRASDTSWTSVFDAGAGAVATDAVVFAYNGVTPGSGTVTNPSATTKYAFVGFGDGLPMAWSTDGSSWTQTFGTQTVTVSGSPTGGTFTLTYSGATTSALAYNAAASAVQTALRALSGLGSVTVSGSAGGPYVVTFAGLGEPLLLTATASLTGGSTPGVTVANTTVAMAARAFAVTGGQFYRARDVNMVTAVDVNADPTTAANWQNPNAFRIGDKTSGISSLAVLTTGALLILKTDGAYSLDDSGNAVRYWPGIAGGGTADDGTVWGTFINDTYVVLGRALYRVAPTLSFGVTHLDLTAIGPERVTENDSPVKGRVTAFSSGGHNAYASLYDDDTGHSWLLKFGSWVNGEVAEGQLSESKRLDAWHGSITPTFSGKKIQALFRSTVGAPSGHSRLYLGFSDGTVQWFTLPCVPNPAACSDYTFSAADGTLDLPLWHGGFEVDNKTLRGCSVLATTLDADNDVQVNYKTTPGAAAWTPLGTNFAAAPLQRVQFPNNTAALLAAFQLVFKGAPVVHAVAIHHQVRPALLLTWAFTVLAATGLVKRNGTPIPRGAQAIRDAIKAAASATGTTQLILPDERSKQVAVISYKESQAWDQRLSRWSAALAVEAVEFQTNTVYGSWARASAYQWGALTSYTWAGADGL